MCRLIKMGLVLLLMISSKAYAGNDSGGMNVEEYWKRLKLKQLIDSNHYINEKVLKEITEANGYHIQRTFLKPAMRAFLNKEVPKQLQELQDRLRSVREELMMDIMASDIVLGDCGSLFTTASNRNYKHDHRESCTAEKPGAPIILDVSRLTDVSMPPVKLESLLSYISHEYVHHFAGGMDHPNYYLVEWMESFFLDNSKAEAEFGVRDLRVKGPNDNLWYVVGFIKWSKLRDSLNAQFLCEDKGYLYLYSYKVHTTDLRAAKQAEQLGVGVGVRQFRFAHYDTEFNEKPQEMHYKLLSSKVKIVSKLVCGNDPTKQYAK